MISPNFARDIEAINARIDIAKPAVTDLLAIAEACRYRSVTFREDGSPIPMCAPKAHDHFFANYGTDRIKRAVEHYAALYPGEFEFMVEMSRVVNTHGKLSMKQAAGVLNVMLAEAKRHAKRTGDLPATLEAA